MSLILFFLRYWRALRHPLHCKILNFLASLFGLPLPFPPHVQLLLFPSSAPVVCLRCGRHHSPQLPASPSSPVLRDSEDDSSDEPNTANDMIYSPAPKTSNTTTAAHFEASSDSDSLPDTDCLTPESYNPCFNPRFISNIPSPVTPPMLPVASPHPTVIVSASSLSMSLGCASSLTSSPQPPPCITATSKAKNHLHEYTSQLLSKSRYARSYGSWLPPTLHTKHAVWFTDSHRPAHLHLGKDLGHGIDATVVQAQDDQGHLYALKVMSRTNRSVRYRRKWTTHGAREALMHSNMQRKCSMISPSPLVGLYGLFEDDCERHDILILEYMAYGDLFDAVVRTQSDVAAIVYDIALALRQCHSVGCVHGDIKSENIMVDRNGRMKLADFGWSFHVGDGSDDDSEDDEPCDRELLGTEEFRAPEVWKYSGRRRRLGPEVDMWSLGVVAYELIFGCLPFEGDGARYWWKWPSFRAASDNVGVDVDADGINLVKGLLRRNVQQRLTAECVLANGWITKFGQR